MSMIQDIKDLRQMTGAGMTDVKKALEEAGGDREAAIKLIRERGLAKAAKREGNATSEGLVAVKIEDAETHQIATMIEMNAETDFVVKNDKFISLADAVLDAVTAAAATNAEEGLAAPAAGGTVADLIAESAGTLGEKIVLRRVARVEGEKITTYLHKSSRDLPPSVGVVIVTDEAGAKVAKDVAMHTAHAAPEYLTRDQVPASVVDEEREIVTKQSIAEGKPEAALPKIVEGRLGGFFKQVVLEEQALVQDAKITVGKHVANAGGKITEFVRFRVGN
ncbi:MAG: translation elongation factor Ts [Promicromonosporaceae bacterium]|nr:translation elongation factor Ts [Promicromonosporaceae bacterium]